jgi:hypothetical protein
MARLPACVSCKRFFRVKKNGVFLATSAFVHAGDLFVCDGCGVEIIAGYGKEPVAEHWDHDEFEDWVKRADLVLDV